MVSHLFILSYIPLGYLHFYGYITKSQNDQLPVVLIAQLVEHWHRRFHGFKHGKNARPVPSADKRYSWCHAREMRARSVLVAVVYLSLCNFVIIRREGRDINFSSLFSLQLIWRIESRTLLQSQPSVGSRSLEYLSNVTGTGPSRLMWLLETGLLVFVGYILAYYIPQVSWPIAFVSIQYSENEDVRMKTPLTFTLQTVIWESKRLFVLSNAVEGVPLHTISFVKLFPCYCRK